MSFILDALQKAERERQLGRLPGLASVPLQAPRDGGRAASRLPWLLLGLACVLASVLAVLAFGREGSAWLQSVAGRQQADAGQPAVAGSAHQRQTVAPAPAAEAPTGNPPPGGTTSPAVAPPPAADPAVRALATEPAGNAGPKPARLTEKTAKEPKPPQKPQPQATRTPDAKPAAMAAATAKKADPASPAADAGSAEQKSRLPSREQLPEALRQQLPPLVLGGYIYSAAPADRSILVNGRLLREGESVTPDLRLEQMRPDGVVLEYKGTRFRMPY